MKMRKMLAVLLMILLSNTCFSQEEESVQLSTFWRIESGKYLDPGILVYDDLMFKVNLTATWKSGWYADVFHSSAFGECFENEDCASQEWDLQGGWKNYLNQIFPKAPKHLFGHLKVSHFFLGKTSEVSGDVSQIKGRLQYKAWSIEPYVETNFQYLHGDNRGGGFLSHVGATLPIDLPGKWSLSISGDITHDGVPFRENGLLLRYDPVLTYTVDKRLSVSAWRTGSIPITDFDDRSAVGVWGIGFVWTP